MNIAVFIKSTTFHPGFGGLETLNSVLCEGLASRGHSVTVFSPKKGLNLDEQKKNGVSYVFVPCVFRALFSNSKRESWINQSFEYFKKYNSNAKFDIVLGQSSAALGVIRHKKELDVKVVSISHGTIMSEYRSAFAKVTSLKGLLKLLLNTQYVLRTFFGSQREFVNASTRIVAVSSIVKNLIVEETYIPEDRVDIIYNGVDESLFNEYQRKISGNVQLIYVGRLLVEKGIIEMVDLLSDPKFKDVTLNIVGDGDDLQKMKDYAQDLGVLNRIVFHGKVPHENVIPKLFESDIFVFPTKRVEGFPMTLVEAMFAGVPVVAYNMGGVIDSVIDSYTGFLITPGNISDFKEKLLKLVEDPNLRKNMSNNSILRAKKDFSLNSMLDKYELVIKKVLEGEIK